MLVIISQERYDISFPDNEAKMLSSTISQVEEEIERGNIKPLIVQ